MNKRMTGPLGHSCAGFSLLELLVIVVLLGALSAPLIKMIADRQTEQDRNYRKAREGIMIINSAMAAWSVDVGKPLPLTEQGLQAFVDAGYFESIPKDPWGQAFRYTRPGRYKMVDIWSRGPDAIDSDDDVANWNLFGPATRYDLAREE